MPSKRDLVRQIVAQLTRDLEVLAASAKAAHEAATHEESRQEDKHDTRGLEASYLAGAQLTRMEGLRKLIALFGATDFRDYGPNEPIGIGALVELDLDGRRSHSLLATQGGGLTVSSGQKTVHVITPLAPLGEALLGRRAGDTVEIESQQGLREYEIIAIS